jgi:hypothetical protein
VYAHASARVSHITQLAYFNAGPWHASTQNMGGLHLTSGRWSSEEVNSLLSIKTTLNAAVQHVPHACAMGMLDLLQDKFAQLQDAVYTQECQDGSADSVEARTALFAHVAAMEVLLDEESQLDGLKSDEQVALCQGVKRACSFLATATPTEPREH